MQFLRLLLLHFYFLLQQVGLAIQRRNDKCCWQLALFLLEKDFRWYYNMHCEENLLIYFTKSVMYFKFKSFVYIPYVYFNGTPGNEIQGIAGKKLLKATSTMTINNADVLGSRPR